MNDSALADALRPAPCVILQLSLLKYSLGHELLLLSHGNPLLLLSEADFAKLPATEQRQAIIRAVQVCSRPWSDRDKPHRWMRLWTWLNRRTDFALAIAEFRNYRWAGSTFPRLTDSTVIPNDQKGRELGSPHLAGVLNFALPMFGQSAYDQPLGFLQFLYFSALELAGNLRVENTYERNVREQVAKIQEDYAREQAELRAKAKEGECRP